MANGGWPELSAWRRFDRVSGIGSLGRKFSSVIGV